MADYVRNMSDESIAWMKKRIMGEVSSAVAKAIDDIEEREDITAQESEQLYRGLIANFRYGINSTLNDMFWE